MLGRDGNIEADKTLRCRKSFPISPGRCRRRWWSYDLISVHSVSVKHTTMSNTHTREIQQITHHRFTRKSSFYPAKIKWICTRLFTPATKHKDVNERVWFSISICINNTNNFLSSAFHLWDSFVERTNLTQLWDNKRLEICRIKAQHRFYISVFAHKSHEFCVQSFC